MLPERVAVYELASSAADTDLRYRPVAALPCSRQCTALLLLPDHVLLAEVGRSSYQHTLPAIS